MKKILKSILFVFTLLLSCSTKTDSSISMEKDYDSYIYLHIKWEEIFKQFETHYLIYVYSASCGHCNEIKNEVLCFIDLNIIPVYLIVFEKGIPISNKEESKIGISSIDELSIIGTPSLIDIEEGIVKNNLGGSNKILDYLKIYSSPS